MTVHSRFAAALDRIATATSVRRTRTDDGVRAVVHGGTNGHHAGRIEQAAARLERLADRLERQLG